MRVHRWGIGFVVAVAALLPTRSRAVDRIYLQDRGEEVSWLRLGPISGWAEMRARARRDDAEGFEIRETLLSPGIHLGTDGSIYHDELLAFSLAGTLSLEDQRVRGDRRRDDRSTFALYDGTACILDHKRINGSAAARRDDAWVESPYRESTRIRTSSRGGELRMNSATLPTGLAWDHTERKEDFRDVTRMDEHDALRASMSHRIGVSRTDVSARWVDTRRSFQAQDYRTATASLDNTLRPAKDSVSRLQSSVRWFNQYGSLRRRHFDVSEDARTQMTPDLESHARYQFTEQVDPSGAGPGGGRSLIRMNRGDLGARHELWGSLATAVDVQASRRNVFAGTDADRERTGFVEQKGLRAGWDYGRRTPWGSLRLGFDWERAREQQESQDRFRSVSDESHVLRDGSEPRLDNAGVDVTTIVVTDDTGFVVFEEGLDYTVLPVGSRASIFRLPGGDITDGQTILVDYVFAYSPDLTFDTTGKTFHFRFDGARWASLHYRYDRHREDFVSGVADGFLEDQRTHLAGVDLRASFLTLSEEYEVQRLLASEFRTNRIRLGADRQLSRTTWLFLEAGHSRSEFAEVDRVQTLWTGTVRVNGTLVRGIALRAEAWTRLDRVNRAAAGVDADLYGARLELGKSFRDVTASLGVSHRDSDRNGLPDRRSQVYVSLRRAFRVGGRAS